MDTPPYKFPIPDRFETELKRCFAIIKALDLGVTKDGKFVKYGEVLHPNQLVTDVLRKYHAAHGTFKGNTARRLVNHALTRTHSDIIQAMLLAAARVEGESCPSP